MAGIRRFYFQFMDTASSPECLSSTQILYENYIFRDMKNKTSENHGRLRAGSVEKSHKPGLDIQNGILILKLSPS